jgi:hypothetical protein
MFVNEASLNLPQAADCCEREPSPSGNKNC